MTRERGAVVIDSAALVALLADRQRTGDRVASTIDARRLVAPHPVRYEAGNSLRRRLIAGAPRPEDAHHAYATLESMRIDLWPVGRTSARAWELRGSVTYYDASYVALAELLDAPLVTLDRRARPGTWPRMRLPHAS